MAEVKWIKIVTDIFDDEKMLMIESLPERDGIIVIWFKLLCLAGKQNNSGVFMFNDKIPYTDEMLSTIFRRPLNTVRLALTTFEQYGMIEIVNNTITIPKWEKHQKVESLDMYRENGRKRVAKFREKQKEIICNVTSNVTSNVTHGGCNVTVTGIEKEKEKEKDKNIKENKKEKLTDFDRIILNYTDNENLQQILKDFIKLRKALKSPMTDRALILSLSKLDALGKSDKEKIAVVSQSIERGWKGLFPLKEPIKVEEELTLGADGVTWYDKDGNEYV